MSPGSNLPAFFLLHLLLPSCSLDLQAESKILLSSTSRSSSLSRSLHSQSLSHSHRHKLKANRSRSSFNLSISHSLDPSSPPSDLDLTSRTSKKQTEASWVSRTLTIGFLLLCIKNPKQKLLISSFIFLIVFLFFVPRTLTFGFQIQKLEQATETQGHKKGTINLEQWHLSSYSYQLLPFRRLSL